MSSVGYHQRCEDVRRNVVCLYRQMFGGREFAVPSKGGEISGSLRQVVREVDRGRV